MLKAQAESQGEPIIVRKTIQNNEALHREVKEFDDKIKVSIYLETEYSNHWKNLSSLMMTSSHLQITQTVREWDLGKVPDLATPDVREPALEDRKKREEERRVRREKRSLSPSQEGPGMFLHVL